jgi:uncharacterized protein YpuA (DUF1002 family)
MRKAVVAGLVLLVVVPLVTVFLLVFVPASAPSVSVLQRAIVEPFYTLTTAATLV